MKYLLSLLVLLSLIFTSYGQKKENFYGPKWLEVYRLELKELPKSALEIVDSVYNHAKANHNADQRIKALIYQSKFASILEEDAELKVVNRFKEEVKQYSGTAKSVLHNYLAEIYFDYLQRNRWQLFRRTKNIEKVDSIDYRTWDLQTLLAEANSQYQLSVRSFNQKTNDELSAFNSLVDRYDSVDIYRPTLFDILVHNAIDFYKTGYSAYYVKSSYDYAFTSDHFKNFKGLSLPASDSIPEVEIIKLYDKLYRYHTVRQDTNAFVKLDLERLNYVFSKVDQQQYQSTYFESLDRLKKQAGTHDAAALVDFALASRYLEINEKLKAIEICKEVLKSYPNSNGAEHCQVLIEHIEARDFEVTAEQYVVPNLPSKLLISYKNLDSIFLKIFKLSQQQEDRFVHLYSDSSKVAFIKTLSPYRQQHHKLIDPRDYEQHTTEVVVPALEKGSYVIVTSVSDSSYEDIFAYDMIQVTSLALIEGTLNNQKRFQIVDRTTGAPIKDCKLQLRNDPDRYFEIRFSKSLSTDEQGFAFIELQEKYIPIVVDAIFEGDTVSFGRYHINKKYTPRSANNDNDYVKAKAFLFTDRSIYRPGQTLYFKGVLLKKSGNKSSLLTGEYVEVYLDDVNGEEIGFLRLKVNEYGSFSGKFKIPEHGITGEYTLYADMDYEEDSKFYDKIMDDFEWSELSISVEEYKRPTFEASFEAVNKTFSVNDTVSVHGKAESFSGANITNAKVTYSIQRMTQLPTWYGWHYNRWRYSSPVEIASGETVTDEEGKYTINFKALPDNSIDRKNLPVFNYEITAAITDISGETHETKSTVKVGYHQLEASLSLAENIDLQKAENYQLSYEIKNLNGQSTSAKGKIAIYLLESPRAPLRKRTWSAPDQPIIKREEFKKLFPHESYGDNSNWKSWSKSDTIKTYSFDSTSADLPLVKLSVGAYLAQLTTRDELGNKIKAEAYFKVYNSKSDKVGGNQLFEIKTDQISYDIGDEVKLSLGTSSKKLTVFLDIDKGHKIQETQIIHLSDETKTISFDVTKGDTEGFAIHYYLVNYNSYESGTKRILVRQPDEKIQLETVTFRDKIMPGAEETWAFKIKGDKKEQKGVEILASMYDASLDQFKPHEWQFNPLQETQNYYYAYNPNSESCFNNNRFKVNNLDYRYHYYRKPTHKHNELNWFGFSLVNNNANESYLRRLRSINLRQVSKINFSNDKSRPDGYIYGTVTSAEDGTPLPAVNVVIKGTTTGTITDTDGQYTIPYEKGNELVFSFIGFQTEEVKPENQNIVDIQLAADVQHLSEVVVTAYGEVAKKSLTSAIVESADNEAIKEEIEVDLDVAIAGSAAGIKLNQNKIMIRGNSSINGEQKPLYVVDGVIVTESDISTDDLASMQVLEGAAATALYGTQATNGVVIIKTKSGQRKLDEMLAKVEARKDLRETAFFYPHLETNKSGEISFKFDAPETLTRWKLQLLAHNKELKTGYKSLNTVTQKELMVVPNTPRFLRHGDQIELPVKVVNLTDQPHQVQVKLSIFNAETNEEITENFFTEANKTLAVTATGSNKAAWSFNIPKAYNAIMYKVVATNGTYSDGEQKIIPVLSNRQLVTETLPMTVKGNSSKQFELEPLTNNKSSTIEHHKVTLEVTSNPIWQVIKSLPYLMEYPYECSEQTFSRLYANLLASEIVKKNKSIKSVFAQWKSSAALVSNLEKNTELKALLLQETPWLREAKTEAEQQKRIALLFDLDKVAEQSNTTFKKLYQMQLNSGGFPWFSGRSLPNRYITQHILAGFGHLEYLNIQPEFTGYKWMINGAVRYLDKQLVDDYKNLIEDSTTSLNKKHVSGIQIHYLYARSFFDHEMSGDFKKVFNYYSKQAARYWTDFDLLSKAMIALTLYRQENTQLANDIIISLEESSITSEEMGMYWKANNGGYRWNEAEIETQALLIEAFSEIKSDTLAQKVETINEMKNWLFKHKQVNSWSTTKATTEAVYSTLLNENLEALSKGKIEVQVGNQTIEPSETESGTGYFKKQWNKEAVSAKLGNIRVNNNDEKLVYGSLYWQYFEDNSKITTSSTNALQLTKKIFKVTRDNKGEVLNAIDEASELQPGDLLRVRITLKADRDMEFLHMKDQRASGLEPTSTLSRYKWQDGLGYYQATKDASTNFFFDEVPKGVYVFEYDLRANNSGSFSNGITTIQNMYAPEFRCHSNGSSIKIKKR